jgi:hypothetical protein
MPITISMNQPKWTSRHIRAKIQMFLFSLQALSAETCSRTAVEGVPSVETKARSEWYSYRVKDEIEPQELSGRRGPG